MGMLLSHSVSPTGRLLAPWENSAIYLVGKISTKGRGHPHFHGFFVFAYCWSTGIDFNVITMRNHRAAAPLLSISRPGVEPVTSVASWLRYDRQEQCRWMRLI